MKNKKILIIEDDDVLVQLLKDKFASKKNFSVFSAGNGEEGLEMAFKKFPDVILLDIILPEMDGAEVLSKLKADKRLKDIPVIMLTNLSESKKVIEATKLGAYDYLVKVDFTLEDVFKKIERALESN